jgi:hypothetical protein
MAAVVAKSRSFNDENSEREPLLSQNSQLGDTENGDAGVSATDDDLRETVLAGLMPEPMKWTAWNITFYISLAAFGIFLLVIVIKGFVDAKDPSEVDVRF